MMKNNRLVGKREEVRKKIGGKSWVGRGEGKEEKCGKR